MPLQTESEAMVMASPSVGYTEDTKTTTTTTTNRNSNDNDGQDDCNEATSKTTPLEETNYDGALVNPTGSNTDTTTNSTSTSLLSLSHMNKATTPQERLAMITTTTMTTSRKTPFYSATNVFWGECAYTMFVFLICKASLLLHTRTSLTSCQPFYQTRIRIISSIMQGQLIPQLQQQQQQQQQRGNKTVTAFGKKNPQQLRGIRNYGQTCFMNVVLQSLAVLDAFQRYLQSIVAMQQQPKQQQQQQQQQQLSVSFILLQVLSTIHGGRQKSSSSIGMQQRPDPRELLWRIGKQYPQFHSAGPMLLRFLKSNQEQQDAQEFLQVVLDIIQEEAKQQQQQLQQKQQPQQQEASLVVVRNDKKSEEEKKWEESEIVCDPQKQSTIMSSSKKQLRTAHVVSSPSPLESPLCGKIGSVLQCRSCSTIRPIQTTPFVDIPIVPSAVSALYDDYPQKASSSSFRNPLHNMMTTSNSSSSSSSSCTLEECLDQFTKVEAVSNVECIHCTVQRYMQEMQEEVDLLQDACQSLKNKKNTSLQQELQLHQTHLNRLQQLSNTKPKTTMKEYCPDYDRDAVQAVLTSYQQQTNDDDENVDDNYNNHKNLFSRSDALKCLLITQAPQVLCIHVQRRYYDPMSDRMTKTMQHVEFPLVLDISPYCRQDERQNGVVVAAADNDSDDNNKDNDNNNNKNMAKTSKRTSPRLYQLSSVMEHRGNAFGGHYVSYRRQTKQTKQWYCISDDHVVPVPWQQVRTCQAYMLIYEAIL